MGKNNYVATNKEWWEKMVKEECGYTKPWLDLDVKVLQKLSKGELKKSPEPLKSGMYPISILSDVGKKNVLCLASGGGQQSAVFALLGANVTVVDIAEGQLEGDKKAAEHYGYKVKTIQGNMSDLSMLKNNSFDIVFQATSMAYVPDVKKVYSEVARVLRSGGLYRADAHNPQAQFIDESSWNGEGYIVSVPYKVKKKQRSEDKNVLEYRHYLDETFNGLVEAGFIIERVEETPKGLYQNKDVKPGTWEHLLRYAPGGFCILARKK